jgi:hypothetical protein
MLWRYVALWHWLIRMLALFGLAKDIKVTRTDTVRSGNRPNQTLPLQSLGAAPAK